MVVMIPKGVGTDFRGIGLVGVLWKTISGIINCQISSSIYNSMMTYMDFARGEEQGPPPLRISYYSSS